MREVRFARSATKHGVHKTRIRWVLDHAGVRFRIPAPADRPDDRLLYVGDDREGVAMEVIVVRAPNDDLVVIHAMELRPKYLHLYEEALRWRS